MHASQAQKFRDLADNLNDQIADKSTPRETNTARKQRLAQKVLADARFLKLVQDKLYALADAHEDGSILPLLKGITDKTQVETLLTYSEYPRGDASRKRMQRAGLETSTTYQSARKALLDMGNPDVGKKTDADELRELEMQVALKPIQGFYPTPASVSQVMLDIAHIDDDGTAPKVLEPSAGRGDLVDAILRENPKAQVDVCEINPDLREILTLKGYDPIFSDFLALPEEARYDVILMNPPFEKRQDVDHVHHAYKFLKPGGRLVAIVCEGTFNGQDKKAKAFRDWLDANDAVVDPLPDDSFKTGDRPTGVAARLVTIDKDQQVEPGGRDDAWEDHERESHTPMFQCWQAVKDQYPDHIVIMRVGDFYEAFQDDAEQMAEACNLVLTSRAIQKGQRVPMAGFPHHTQSAYIAQLMVAGHSVAVLEPEDNGQHRVARVIDQPKGPAQPPNKDDDDILFALSYPVDQVKMFTDDWDQATFERALELERANKNRKTVIGQFERALNQQAPPDEDQDERANQSATNDLDQPAEQVADAGPAQLCLLPREPLPPPAQLVFSVNDLVFSQDGSPYVRTTEGPLPVAAIDKRNDLYESLRDVGQIKNITVLVEHGQRKVVDGLHRVRAWWQLAHDQDIGFNDPVIYAFEYDAIKGWNAGAILGLTANAMRRSNPLMELSKIESLLKDFAPDGVGSLTDDELKQAISSIAKATGLAFGTVKKRLRLLDLQPALRQGVEDGLISVGAAQKAAKLPNPLQKELTRRLEDGEKITHKDVSDVRRVQVQEAAALFDPADFATPGAEEAAGERISQDELDVLRETVENANGQVELPAEAAQKLISEVLYYRKQA